ncbi:uncharacterized protein LOC128204300 [Mya arenaria]|uniref:uncharacterized protein LOC128204300 n=1 Tax=Mya arenaria TaxID=6604 RepID=UPI0022E59EA7|nr:uncharacterized protein LOC128204300 [Mya arenaria]
MADVIGKKVAVILGVVLSLGVIVLTVVLCGAFFFFRPSSGQTGNQQLKQGSKNDSHIQNTTSGPIAVDTTQSGYSVSFLPGKVVGHVTFPLLTETSGICASRRYKDVLYTHNDSGGLNRIFALNGTSGDHLLTIYIEGATHQDWEDIAYGPCGTSSSAGGYCIFVADTGGNAGGLANTIFRIAEPQVDFSLNIGSELNVPLDSTLKFSWDQYDCETIMVDEQGEVYVISKVMSWNQPKLAHLPRHAWGTNQRVNVSMGVFLPELTSNRDNPTAGDISPDGTEVLLKTYQQVLYWHVPDRDYFRHMARRPAVLLYIRERQGEAVCWDAASTGYYTLGEDVNATLYYYRRVG